MIDTSKTAIGRSKPSAPTRFYETHFKPTGMKTILDYGCGKGADVRWLNEQGYEAVGYDPNFCPNPPPDREFDVVILNYVLNVIPMWPDRFWAIKNCLSHLKKNGFFCVAVRPKAEIVRRAKEAGWRRKFDGFITKSNTFQHGYTPIELVQFLQRKSITRICDSRETSCSVAVMFRKD